MRTAYLLLGHTSMALGFIGIVVPLLPTTPFVLLAAACYSRGSVKFHTWLHRHPRFGPMIRDWREHGAIGGRPKVAATTMILASGFYTFMSLSRPWNVLTGAVLAAVLVFILTRPTHVRSRRTPQAPDLTDKVKEVRPRNSVS